MADQTESRLVDLTKSHLVDQTESHLVHCHRSPKVFRPHGWLLELFLTAPSVFPSPRGDEGLRLEGAGSSSEDGPPGEAGVRSPDLGDIGKLITQIGKDAALMPPLPRRWNRTPEKARRDDCAT